jgi:hypothetical protein
MQRKSLNQDNKKSSYITVPTSGNNVNTELTTQSRIIIARAELKYLATHWVWIYLLLLAAMVALTVTSFASFVQNEYQRGFVYLAVYDGPLIVTKGFSVDTLIEPEYIHTFHPQLLIWIPVGVATLFMACQLKHVYQTKSAINQLTDGTEIDYPTFQKHYAFAKFYARYFFGVVNGCLVTVVMFIYGLRDASHLITLTVYHCSIFTYLYPSVVAEFVSFTPAIIVECEIENTYTQESEKK